LPDNLPAQPPNWPERGPPSWMHEYTTHHPHARRSPAAQDPSDEEKALAGVWVYDKGAGPREYTITSRPGEVGDTKRRLFFNEGTASGELFRTPDGRFEASIVVENGGKSKPHGTIKLWHEDGTIRSMLMRQGQGWGQSHVARKLPDHVAIAALKSWHPEEDAWAASGLANFVGRWSVLGREDVYEIQRWGEFDLRFTQEKLKGEVREMDGEGFLIFDLINKNNGEAYGTIRLIKDGDKIKSNFKKSSGVWGKDVFASLLPNLSGLWETGSQTSGAYGDPRRRPPPQDVHTKASRDRAWPV